MENFISPPKFIAILFESNGISMDMLIFVHLESDEFLHGMLDLIWVAEYSFEFLGEGSPCHNLHGLIPLLDISLEMPLSGTGKMLYCINNMSPVCGVSKWFSVKN